MIAKLNFGQIILIIVPKARQLLHLFFVIFIAKSRKKNSHPFCWVLVLFDQDSVCIKKENGGQAIIRGTWDLVLKVAFLL